MSSRRAPLSDIDARLLSLMTELAKNDRQSYRELRRASWDHVVERFRCGDISFNSKTCN